MMSSFKRISVYQADDILGAFKYAQILEYRARPNKSKCLHPQGSVLDDSTMRNVLKTADKSQPVIVYTLNGDNSDDIAQMLGDFGFKHSYSVNGGYAAWQNQVIDRFKIRDKLRFWLKSRGFDNALYNINSRIDNHNRTALMHAARYGQTDILRALLSAGADPNYTDDQGNSALWYACIGGYVDCVKSLINADAEVDNSNFRGFTALDYCVGHETIARTIVESYQTANFNL